MATTEVFYNGDGTDVTFTIPFEYLEESDVKVSVGGVLKTQDTDYTFSTITEITFGTAPASGTNNVRVFRDTDIDSGVRNEFFAGSAIRAQDLNDDFLQVLFSAQELEDQFVTKTSGEFDTNVDMNSNRITELGNPVNAQDAVTKQYLEDNYFDDGTETIVASETWPDNDTTIATTASIDNRIDSKIDAAVEGDVLIDNTGLTKSATGGQVTLGIGAGSVDLDRIKATDLVTSSESNPNNDTTIATTAKIDDMIDAAITGDIAVNSTGLTLANDGDGTITLGIGTGAVDLDRINPTDIITLSEQDAGPTTDDDSIFTSSAAAKRFDTFVQTGTPAGAYQVGKTWLQNDDDQTLKIWNGTTWLDVASGGSFRTQDKVIYVDATGGDDAKTGHRISGPKLTIKAAINDINADVSTSIKTAGSGYANSTYSNVPLTGGTTGSGLTATITVSSGSVTSVTNVANSTLQEYQIGDILSAADSNLGGGGGSGFELEVTGGGDGMTVIVSAGTYQEIAPIQIKRRNVSIIGMALRSCIVHPTPATEKPSSAGNSALFEINSGSFIQNLTLTGMHASNSGNNSVDSDLPDKQGWNFAFYDDAFITKSPYVQNCTNFSDSQIDNSDLRSHRPRGGTAGDLTNAPTGGGMLIDGSVPKTTSPLRSMVADSYTHVGLNGPGILVVNNGYAQCTSSYAFFNKYHIKALNGGQANLAASTTDFGEKALVADGKSTAAIFSGQVKVAAASGAITFDVDNISAGTNWFGDDTKPASNMLVTVNSITYPILSSTVITGGHRVSISRPNPSQRSQNLGLNGAIAEDAAVQFFLRSQIASSGHTMEYVGSGMDYDALPENGGVPDETKQITELNNGKIWTAITDHNGKFKIGGNQTDDPIFEVDQQLGFITIPTGSIAFDLLSDPTPQLGGNLDVNSNTITGLPTSPSATTEATSKAYVDAGDATNATNIATNVTNIAARLPLAGGTMTGNIVFNSGQTIAGYTPRTSATGSSNLSVGTTAQRDGSPAAGMIRYNSTLGQFEGYGSAWGAIGGGATGGGSDTWAVEHDNTITQSYTISTGKNVVSAGPLTVNSGATVTVPSGSNWVIV
ncbi:hypothetical protein [uncultured phage_MedDCM-OCT-S45-C4]|uniref:Bacteriophage T7 tail fibre protein-like N-terminal domain-containing protein n=1 Tax=uncultured phage_MedDCM-OCT-S45-C4 TaxID=2740801 RepID=A0A6S4PDB0_9CAUD|nr:hypothetical protein HOQ58_gp27 [uncultured phage_MedDCM-OCT-S45-C4]BAQ93968.1 hypothetical protein [uncultured phage_MedDCM-OCT-S45-C4]